MFSLRNPIFPRSFPSHCWGLSQVCSGSGRSLLVCSIFLGLTLASFPLPPLFPVTSTQAPVFPVQTEQNTNQLCQQVGVPVVQRVKFKGQFGLILCQFTIIALAIRAFQQFLALNWRKITSRPVLIMVKSVSLYEMVAVVTLDLWFPIS